MAWRPDFNSTDSEIYQKRLKRLTLVVFFVFSILFSRLWFLQIINGSDYRKQSENNRISLRDLSPFRGLIYDRNGELLADNRPSFNLSLIPGDIKNIENLMADLCCLVQLEEAQARKTIQRALRENPFSPLCLKKNLTRNELAKIEGALYSMPGVFIEVRPQRHYLYGSLAAHAIGYLGEINKTELNNEDYTENRSGDFVGKCGIEKEWHKYLNGVRGGQQVEVDAWGRKLQVLFQKDAEPGYNVGLTIDKDLQELAEQSLQKNAGAIVAMNPYTGELLAVASSPRFDPNDFAKGMDRKGWKKLVSNLGYPLQNRVISGQYPPGSLFKIVVALAGLEKGIIDFQEKLFCKGYYDFKGREYRDWKTHGHGPVDLHQALVESCDVYFYSMGHAIGIDAIAQYARHLGFGSTTGLHLKNEKPGLIPDRIWKRKRWNTPWQEGETLSVSVGQSFILVTPIQMVRFFSALFNGGILYRPQLTKWVGREGEENIFEMRPEVMNRWNIRQQNIDLVKQALLGVVNEPRGTGSRAKLESIMVAGKTGTAQVIALPEDKEKLQQRDIPYKFRDHAWFAAVAPFEKPLIAIAVVIEHSGTGGLVAAPIAKSMFECYFKKKGLI